MRMEAGLQVRQEMHMKLAPQVIQSIEILQLPLMELERRIDQELEENPVLERTDSDDEATPELEQSEEESPDADLDEVTVVDENDAEQFERLDDLTEYYEKHNLGEARPKASVSAEKGAKQEALENSPCPDLSLHDHLRAQLSYFGLDEPLSRLCENIISNLDDRGYLAHPLEDMAESVDHDLNMEQAEDALKTVQSLEPPGVGARDLQECLLLQLDLKDDDYELMSLLIRDFLEDIKQNRLPKVASRTGRDIEEIKQAVNKMGALNPRPGAVFTNPVAPHVIPDVNIRDGEGGYDVVLENAWLPSLRISAYYARRLQEEDLDDATREYLTKKLQGAQGIISAIEQRRDTLERVTEEIVKAQKEFFDKGEMHLKPLKMQDVADAVGVHVSTVSRAIANKYAQTPQGVYPLKRFFTGGTRKKDGDVESWDVVRRKLLHVVELEDKKKPLSDDAIAGKLQDEGIDIARRTVAKYRNKLDIPSSRLRKEH